ncbi:class I SAM-dependent methyltransferase [Candidatus Woesearchaeota archaeon]|nr:class I SAM-dependent methyltransferase [Candidatus Woesearchaeota archaeon]
MKKMPKPRKPDEEKYIFTEGIDYSQTGKASIWGKGDKDTLELIERTEIHGKWLNLAAGDWGYTPNLLKRADFVVASDIDGGALSKLRQNTPKRYVKKLETKIFDITKRFPFEHDEFDGIFCTGTLHLFPKEIFQKIVLEINRVLKPHGRIIIDFATDIKRVLPNGKLLTFGKEPLYTVEEAKQVLEKLFKDYEIKMYESKVPEYLIKTKPCYKFSSKFILLVADKK